MLDWGLRLALLFAIPCALALTLMAKPLISVLLHYGAFSAHPHVKHTHHPQKREGAPGGAPGNL